MCRSRLAHPEAEDAGQGAGVKLVVSHDERAARARLPEPLDGLTGSCVRAYVADCHRLLDIVEV